MSGASLAVFSRKLQTYAISLSARKDKQTNRARAGAYCECFTINLNIKTSATAESVRLEGDCMLVLVGKHETLEAWG